MALQRVFAPLALVREIGEDGGLGREPITAELLSPDAPRPGEEPEVGGAET